MKPEVAKAFEVITQAVDSVVADGPNRRIMDQSMAVLQTELTPDPEPVKPEKTETIKTPKEETK